MINLNANPYDKIMHGTITTTFCFIGWLAGDINIGAALAVGLFYGKEIGEHWMKYKSEYPAGDLKFSIQSWIFINWGKGSQWDWYVSVITAIAWLIIYNQVAL